VTTKWAQLFFFSTRETWKDKDELLGWVRRQANRVVFTVVIKRSCAIRNRMLELVCERTGEHKVPKKKLKHVATGSRKCECLFKVRGYVVKEENAWKLTILNGFHNQEMLPYLGGNLLVGRLMEDDKKIVHDYVKFNMSQNAQIEGHVTYSAFKKTIKVFLIQTDTLDDLKTQLNKCFVFHGEDHSTLYVFVHQPHYDLGEGEEDMWKTVYYPKLIEKDSDI